MVTHQSCHLLLRLVVWESLPGLGLSGPVCLLRIGRVLVLVLVSTLALLSLLIVSSYHLLLLDDVMTQ
jgi:hypothetical protein